MKKVFSLLFIVSIAIGQDYKQFIDQLGNRLGNIRVRDTESELRQKAGIRTENDLSKVIDTSKEREILDLLSKFSEPIRGFTCYQVRKIDVDVIDPLLIKEEIQTNCPADPTFGGICNLVNTQVLEGRECREIKGVRFCRDWWKRALEYSCNGNLSFDTFLSTLEGYQYCEYEKRCIQWQDVEKNGGIVSCRVYYDRNKPGCNDNPLRAECISDDCGELFDKCRLINYTSYSDIKDKANLETTYYCDPVSGMCGYQDIPSTSGVQVGIYTFECPSDVRKVCVSEEIVKKCPDGTQTVCNTVKVCKEWKTSAAVGKTVKSCIAKRKFTDHKVIKGSSEADYYRNNPLCVKLGENSDTIQAKAVFSWGWDGDGGDKCGSCESYVVGLQIKELNRTILQGSNTCYKVSNSPGIFPSESQLASYLNDYLQNLNLPYTVVSVDLNSKLELGTNANPNDRACFGDDDPPGNNKDYEVPITLATTYETFRCFEDSLDTSNCNNLSQCTLISPISNLEELECYEFTVDSENPSKMVCSEYSINYECEESLSLTDCKKWETQINCNSNDIVIPQLDLKGLDFSNDFKEAIAFAQAVNELKHVWTGEPKVCESGWWNSIVENPTDYFINKMISIGIVYFGVQLYNAIKEYAQAASSCLSPGYKVYGTQGVQDCLYTVAQSSYTQEGSPAKDLINKICGQNNATSICDKLTFLSNPWVQFGISLAVDIITSTEKCNSCTSESCASKHNDYQEYVLISKGLCHFVASKCTWKIDVGVGSTCLRRGYKYCCYDSKFARILVEQAYKQLGYSWGSWDNPNCNGLTFDDLKKLDFSQMDFSELIQEIQAKMQYKVDSNYIQNKIKTFYQGNVVPTGETPWGNTQ
ncbi:MAG TPA: hypothetical protein EYG91_04025 [Aquifex aeolicus]|nr:hypothetical protein [Aquifex aeolicus]